MENRKILNDRNLDGIVFRYEINKEYFQSFIKTYIGQPELRYLDELAKTRNQSELFSRLNSIWTILPKNVFNIEKNPKGWREFLEVIEF